MKTIPAAAVCAALLALFALSSAQADDETLTIDISGGESGAFSFSVPTEFLSGLLSGLASEIACDADLDGEVLEMLEHLDRKGGRSKYRFEGDDGESIKARRRDGQLELDIKRPGEKDAHVSLPWSIAECLLGRDVQILEEGEDLRVEITKDGSIVVQID